MRFNIKRSGFLVVILIVSAIYYVFVLHPQQQYYKAHHVAIKGTYLIKPLAIPDFSLTDNHNNPLTKNSLKGHWSLLFFGFTRCGMVCPTTMSVLTKTIKLLENNSPKIQLPQVIFITVDPDHDSVRALNNYVTSFNAVFLGARSTLETLLPLENGFHVTSTKQDDNSFNHTADILLINPEAKIQAYFTYPQQAEELAKNYQAILIMASKTKI